MRAAVRAAFVRFSAPLEGVVPFLYCDVKGLVTTAIGVLVDPISAAVGLPWKRPDGSHASAGEVIVAWNRVKNRQDLRLKGGMAYQMVTDLRLDQAGIEEVVGRTLDRMDRQLAARFPDYPTWPADAQLATLSMAWACGAHFRFPRLEAALRAQDFLSAAVECHISEEGNPGVKPRNLRNQVLYRNASVVVGDSIDGERLWWPKDIWETPMLSPELGDEEATPVQRIPWETVTRLPGSIANDDTDDDPPEAA